MARRHGAHQFARVRQHALSKLCAAWFIVLIVLPFTAPFPTVHLAGSPAHSHDALPKDIKDKTSDHKVAVAFDRSPVLPSRQPAVLHALTPSNPLAAHPSRRTILRI